MHNLSTDFLFTTAHGRLHSLLLTPGDFIVLGDYFWCSDSNSFPTFACQRFCAQLIENVSSKAINIWMQEGKSRRFSLLLYCNVLSFSSLLKREFSSFAPTVVRLTDDLIIVIIIIQALPCTDEMSCGYRREVSDCKSIHVTHAGTNHLHSLRIPLVRTKFLSGNFFPMKS